MNSRGEPGRDPPTWGEDPPPLPARCRLLRGEKTSSAVFSRYSVHPDLGKTLFPCEPRKYYAHTKSVPASMSRPAGPGERLPIGEAGRLGDDLSGLRVYIMIRVAIAVGLIREIVPGLFKLAQLGDRNEAAGYGFTE